MVLFTLILLLSWFMPYHFACCKLLIWYGHTLGEWRSGYAQSTLTYKLQLKLRRRIIVSFYDSRSAEYILDKWTGLLLEFISRILKDELRLPIRLRKLPSWYRNPQMGKMILYRFCTIHSNKFMNFNNLISRAFGDY